MTYETKRRASSTTRAVETKPRTTEEHSRPHMGRCRKTHLCGVHRIRNDRSWNHWVVVLHRLWLLWV